MSPKTPPEPPGQHHEESKLNFGSPTPVFLGLSPAEALLPASQAEPSDVVKNGIAPVPFSTEVQSNPSPPALEPLSGLLATGLAGCPLPSQISRNIPPTKAISNHPRLTMSTEQAFMNMFRVTHTPHVDPVQDPTIAQVEAAREDYIVRLMDAMHNLTNIYDKLNKEGTYTNRVQMFHPVDNAEHGWYVGQDFVESRCHVLFEVIIDRCRKGFRGQAKQDLARKTKPRNGFVKDVTVPSPDMKANCKARIEAIIVVLHYWKTACAEATNDIDHMFALANHPQVIWDTKYQNADSNGVKARKTKELKGKVQEFNETQQRHTSSHDPSPQASRRIAAHEAPVVFNPDFQLPACMPIISEPPTSSSYPMTGDPVAAGNPFQNPTIGPGSPLLGFQAGGVGADLSPHGPSHPIDYPYPGMLNQDILGHMTFTGNNHTVNAIGVPLNPGAKLDSLFASSHFGARGPEHYRGAVQNVTGKQTGQITAQARKPRQVGYPAYFDGPPPMSSLLPEYMARQFQGAQNAQHQDPMGAQDTNPPKYPHESYLRTTQFGRSFDPGHSAPPQPRASSKRPASQHFPVHTNMPARKPKKPRTSKNTEPINPNSQAPPILRPQMAQGPQTWPASAGAGLPSYLKAAHNEAEAEAEAYSDSDPEEDEHLEDSEEHYERPVLISATNPATKEKDLKSNNGVYAYVEDVPESNSDYAAANESDSGSNRDISALFEEFPDPNDKPPATPSV
ncbi:uncharacterized protein N0V89_007815 [Didymosphaeria variabile]|uniref:Uncharacterized protein n=1 Tax=Didymosphaeria variabile TaxID=1932322 RepID=A0A9W9CAT8_9PLEO|nr:uncharacterized protein N0V89_007815 [Didymosphaeria variabile]KAJ4352467.1 hypothetical protein N0V89_007815 [Didymosphaeria variabile]